MSNKMLRAVLLLMVLSSTCLMPQSASATAWRSSSSPSPVCSASGAAPVVLGEALSFCGLSGVSCCDATADADLKEQFGALNIPNDAGCTAIVKDIICAKCVPSSSTSTELFYAAADPTTVARSVPLLCGGSPSPPTPTTSTDRRSSYTSPPPQQDALCLERIHTGSYLGMAPHPDGSSRVFLWTQDGKVLEASVPKRGSRRALRVSNSPILDLTGRVTGLMGVAFHREFATNGRFFVCYACDGASAAAGNGSMPSQPLLVLAEFSVKRGVDNYYSKGAGADPSEERRIFTMDLPLQHTSYSYQQHGGQILFPPTGGDSYLYLIAGHGGGDGDHSRGTRTFNGKIIRFDVDHAAPKPEIFAMGLNSPMACSFDSDRPSDLYCAGVDEEQKELVYLISDQYGNDYRGSSATAIPLVINHGRPAPGRSPSIVGGLTYDGSTDLSLKGRYMYMYGSTVWAAVENAENGMMRSARISNIKCSRSTPIPCYSGRRMSGSVLSLGEDNSKDAFFLSSGGIYRVVEPVSCTLIQPRQSTDAYDWLFNSKNKAAGSHQETTPAQDNSWLGSSMSVVALSLFLLYVAYKKFLPPCAGEGSTPPNECNSCWGSNITYVNNNNYFSNNAASVEMGHFG